MRTPSHAAEIVSSMAKKVKIPVTVKMRAGWNDSEINAPVLAKMVEDAGASAITVHGRSREPRVVTMADRGQFLLDYIDLLLRERVDEEHGFRHEAPMTAEELARTRTGPAQGRERWVINKLRALNSWYTKGLDDGSHLRIAINSATSICELRDLIYAFFMTERTTRADLTARVMVIVP
jgi:tRNA-dihydrouridine synthase